MPGLSNLNDKDFLRAFQVTDAIIQNKQPLFLFTWIGSIVAILTTVLVSLLIVGELGLPKFSLLNWGGPPMSSQILQLHLGNLHHDYYC